MIRKIMTISLFLPIFIGLIPLKPFNRLLPERYYDLVVTYQALGCPCPPFKVLEGEMDIPDSIISKYENLYKDEFVMYPFSLFANNYDILTSEILVCGEVIGAEFISEDSYAPVYKVTRWRTRNYLPIFITFNKTGILVYLALFALGIVYMLVLLVMIIVRKFRSKIAYNQENRSV